MPFDNYFLLLHNETAICIMKNSLSHRLFVEPTNNWAIQLFRYLFVGGLAFIVDYGLLYVLTEYAGMHYIVSATLSFIAGLTVNYLISTHWIFKSGTVVKNRAGEFVIFALIGVVGLVLNNILLYFFTDICGIHYMISKLITTALVMLWNFFGRKLILFNSKD